MEPLNYRRALQRRAWLIALVCVIAAVTAGVVSMQIAKVYEVRTVAMVNPAQPVLPNGSATGGGMPSIDEVVQSYVELVGTAPVRQRVVDNGIPRSAGELATEIRAARRPNTTLVEITVDDRDPLVARNIAQEIVPAFNSALDELQTTVFGAGRQGRLQALVPWEVPTAPGVSVGPHVLLNVIFAFVAALFAGCGLAILMERLDTTLKNEDDASRRLGLPVLGSVATLRKKRGQPARAVEAISLSDPLDHRAESFRMIRTNLLFAEVDKPLRTLVVTSSQPGEGKTSVACNLAITVAQAGKRVILVDADLRSPGIQNVFHRRASLPGLGNLILGQITPEQMEAPRPLPTLQVVYSGLRPPNPSDLFGSSTMADVLRRLGGLADLVILDTPPVDVVTDATVLAAQADGVLLVVDSRRTPLDTVVRAQHKLVAVNANVLGIVLNKVKSHTPDASYQRYYAPAPLDLGANGHSAVVASTNGSPKLQPAGDSLSSPRR